MVRELTPDASLVLGGRVIAIEEVDKDPEGTGSAGSRSS